MKKLAILFLLAAVITTGCSKSDEPETNKINGHEYVDLGLSVKWATCNVGATTPEDWGDHYSWGAVTSVEQLGYSESPLVNIEIDEIGGTQYDVAHVDWGATWRMPTEDEMRELRSQCTWELLTANNIIIYKVTGPNGNSIYLPEGGVLRSTDSEDWRPQNGYYWTSTRLPKESIYFDAYGLQFTEDYKGVSGWNIPNGFSIRPVSD